MNKKFKKTISSIIIIVIALITIIGLSDFTFLIKPDKTQNQRDTNSSMEKVFIRTSDNTQLTANYFTVDKSSYPWPKGWVVFSHMMPSTKESWTDFAKKLQELGYESLAVDLRGHGESQGGPDGFKNFSDSQHQKSILDIEAAVEFLKTKGAETDKIALIGASIGANLSLQYISEHSEFQTAILLSPGLNYRGIKTETIIKKLRKDQKIFFASAKDDPNEGNYKEVQILYDLAPSGVFKDLKIYNQGGHGTNLLDNQSELTNSIIKFIQI